MRQKKKQRKLDKESLRVRCTVHPPVVAVAAVTYLPLHTLHTVHDEQALVMEHTWVPVGLSRDI